MRETDAIPPSSVALLVIALAVAVALSRLLQSLPLGTIAGINGMYYPLMVRELLESGSLPFADVPALFHLAAILVRVTGLDEIAIVELLSIILPALVVLPFAPLVRDLTRASRAIPAGPPLRAGWVLVLLFLAFAPSASSQTTDLVKNAVAMPLAAFSAVQVVRYLIANTRQIRRLVIAAISAVAIALTHFGTFAVLVPLVASLLIFGAGSQAPRGRRSNLTRWLTPAIAVAAALLGAAAVGIADPQRLRRLAGLTGELFERPLLFHGPVQPWYVFALAGTAVLTWMSVRRGIRNWLGLLLPQYLLLVPLWDGEYVNRFLLVVVLPQAIHALLLLAEAPGEPDRASRTLRLYLALAAVVGLLVAFAPQPPGAPAAFTLSPAERDELASLEPLLVSGSSPGDETLVVARHGLEWWVAWTLDVHVAQPSAWDPSLLQRYRAVYSLVAVPDRPDTASARDTRSGRPEPPQSGTDRDGSPSAPPPGIAATAFPQLVPTAPASPVFQGRHYRLFAVGATGFAVK